LPIHFMVGTGGMMMIILERLETCGQIVCSVRRLPIHFMVGTGGTITGDGCARSGDYPPISWWAQAA
ncbi:MAG: hypothetical protein VB026_03495, partial [Anaerolineaceae bacterium]|nr:hypothetical protein [Anaerolineaceae bacterium]